MNLCLRSSIPFLYHQVDPRLWCCCDMDELDDYPNVPLRSLEDVKITGFVGSEQETGLARLLFQSATSL